MTKEKLVELAKEAIESESCFEALRMRNPSDLQERVELDIAYRRAERRSTVARCAYEDAINKYARDNP